VADLTDRQKQEIASLVPVFPDVLQRAVDDWAKFKVGYRSGLFNADRVERIAAWFNEFPRLWETIRPNFLITADGSTIVPRPAIVSQADRFVSRLGADRQTMNLGIAPLIVAGIIIAGLLGVAGAIWAIGYVKEQDNISNMIDEVVAGNLPADVLQEAIESERGSVFSDIGSILKYAVLAGAVVLLWPHISKLLRGDKQ